MRTFSIWTAGGVLLAAANFADAAVLCANPSGSVFVRTACKGNETTLDAAALGLSGGPPGPAGPAGPAGPTGPTGATGPMGPAGSLVPVIAGFVYGDGTIGGSGFTITKIENGHYELRIPVATFTNFPAIAVSAWGIPGVFPTANVTFNIFEAATNSYLADIRLSGADGSTLVDTGFQFVATAIQ